MSDLKKRQDEFREKYFKSRFSGREYQIDGYNKGFDAFRLSPEYLALIEALEWMCSKSAMTIFIEDPEHVDHFFKKARSVLSQIEEK